MTDKVSIKEFEKFEIRTATIKEVKPHPNADKLYILQIDLGNEQRQIVAGIKKDYKPEELIGKQIAVIVNLEPANLRGIESNGMLLAAVSPNGKISILTTDKKIENNSEVR